MALNDPALFCGATYDYVIAGGGTAGLTVAARLSEDPAVTVAVIEAGDDQSGDIEVQAVNLAGAQFDNPLYDWSFRTTPQVRWISDKGGVISYAWN